MLKQEIKTQKVTTRSYWDSVWDLDGNDLKDPQYFYFGKNGLFNRLIRKCLGDISGRSVIEFGGGGLNYRLLNMVESLRSVGTALDYSSNGIAVLEKLFNEKGVAIHAILSDIDKFDVSEKYDIATHWGLAEHFSDPMFLFEKCYGCLKPGGKLLFSMPNMNSFAAKFWRRWCPQNWSKHVLHHPEKVIALLNQCGFVNTKFFYYGVPAIKCADWEKSSKFQYLLKPLQIISSVSVRALPIFHAFGSKEISMEVGFYAEKISR